MKRRIAVLIVTGVFLVGSANPAVAASRDSSARTVVREFVAKAVKEIKSILRLEPAEEFPTPPNPCQTGCP